MVSGYLVTSPYGPLRYHKWICDECPDHGGGLDCERESVRKQATGHIERTGHGVILVDGTSEHLYPVATTAADSEVPS